MSSSYPILDNRPIDQWKVTELKEELKRRKLPIRGLKEELVRRLFEDIKNGTVSDEEIGNSVNPEQDSPNEDQPDATQDVQIEKDSSDAVEHENKQIVSDKAMIDGDNHPDPTGEVKSKEESLGTVERNTVHGDNDTPMNDHDNHLDSAGGASIEDNNNSAVEHEGELAAENDAAMVDNDENNNDANSDGQEAKVSVKDLVSASGLNAAGEEVSPAESVGFNATDSRSLLSKLGSIPDEKHEPEKVACEDTMLNQSEPNDQASEIQPDLGSQVQPAQLASNDQDSVSNELNGDREPPSEDIKHNQPEPNNQVSEVKSDLGYESISSDSVCINEKNELKDNLNANNFPLELEVIKPGMVHPSSSELASIGGDLHPTVNVEEPHENQVPSEKVDATIAKDGDLVKKNDSTEGVYSEKLNLDRSSGDESMEEDVLDTKQIDSITNHDDVEKRNEDNKLPMQEECHVDVVASGSPLKEDIVAQEENKPIVHAEKRKLEGAEPGGVNEPSKRQRRWNSETLKVPDRKISNVTSSGTPKDLTEPTPKRSFSRSSSSVSVDTPKERVVRPSQKPPTNSLRIDNFLRPFTLKAVQELLAKTGTVCSFWMDNIKTHCYVTYSSDEEAVATRNAVYNLQWPPNGGRQLVAEFVDPQEVKMRLEAPPESPVPISPSPTPPSASFQQPQASQNPSRQHGLRQQLPPPPPLPPPPALSDPPLAREQQQLPPPPAKKPEQPILTLDDLFMKTRATPRIYYLPLSEEQVAAKRAELAKSAGN